METGAEGHLEDLSADDLPPDRLVLRRKSFYNPKAADHDKGPEVRTGKGN